MNQANKILEVSQKLFFQHGIKAVSVDDICGELGISKKTLYMFFKSKDKIVSELISIHLNQNQQVCFSTKMTTKDAIEELIEIYKFNYERHKLINPIFISDIRKLYPNEWVKMENFLNISIIEVMMDNLKRGQQEGYFRVHLNLNYIAYSYMKSVLNMIEYFSKQEQYSIGELNREFLVYHIRGIGTEKAFKKLSKLNF
jgi:AcrR family transcriptional regulator